MLNKTSLSSYIPLALLYTVSMGSKVVISSKVEHYCQIFDDESSPNAIADYASLTLNNFVSEVGSNYFNKQEIEEIVQKANDCNIDLNFDSINNISSPRHQKLEDVLDAFDKSIELVNQDNVNLSLLRNLPLWDNFIKWENLVTCGLLYASDIEHFDPKCNSAVKSLLDCSSHLYK